MSIPTGRGFFAVLVLLSLGSLAARPASDSARAGGRRENHSLWVHPPEVVRTPESVRAHPEWAQLNPAGGTTATETLGPRRRPYPYIWMCPARRPGYTDQWLLPMIEAILPNHPADGIHHD